LDEPQRSPRRFPSCSLSQGTAGAPFLTLPRADRQPLALVEPGAELLEAPLVHANLAAATALAAADENGATVPVEITLAERERLLDAKPATPQDDDHGTEASAVATASNLAHHGDDLLHRGWISRISHPLVAGRSSGVVVGHRRR
jgi:hypothetical protein